MGQSKSKSIEELAKLLSGVAENERKIATTERLLADCIIVLYAENGGNHRTVMYEENEVLAHAKDVLDRAYEVVKERDELKAEVEALKKKKETVQFPVYITWWKALFGKKKLARKLKESEEKQ